MDLIPRMNITPRFYQREAVDSLYGYFQDATGNPIIVAPTGSGKGVILAIAAYEILNYWPGQRLLVCTHVKELIEQNYNKLIDNWPEAPAGIYSASIGRRDTQEDIIFGGVQSIYKKPWLLGRFDLLFIDECHLLSEDSEGMYQLLIDGLMKFNKNLKIIGLSATPYRMKSGHLIGGENSIFTDICYEIDVRTLIELGHLCPPRPKRMKTDFDMDKIKTTKGEYSKIDMQRKMDIEELTISAVNEIIDYGKDRKAWLVFCSGVDHAFHVRDEIRGRGYSCETITGKTRKRERESIIANYMNGSLKCITNADVLTTGFDAPHTDLLGIIRGTQSPGLWVQMIGRGMRTFKNKKDCLVLDFGKNTERFGPIDQITIESKKKRKRSEPYEAPTKACPGCDDYVLAMLRVCPSCGFDFPIQETPSFLGTSDDAELLSFASKDTIQELLVDGLFFKKHVTGNGVTLAVTYYKGIHEIAREFIGLEYKGMARANAVNWWRSWVNPDTPKSVDEALEMLGPKVNLHTPIKIRIDKSEKYPKVIGYLIEEPAT